jgi:hypothetical protein
MVASSQNFLLGTDLTFSFSFFISSRPRCPWNTVTSGKNSITEILTKRRNREKQRVLLNKARRELTKLKGVPGTGSAELGRLRGEIYELERKLRRRRHRSDPSVDGSDAVSNFSPHLRCVFFFFLQVVKPFILLIYCPVPTLTF